MPQVQREIRRRGFFGKLVKWVFIAFNLLMAFWLFSYWSDVGGMLNTGSDAERAGAAIGTTIGTSVLVGLWASGSIILGIIVLLTRGQRILITEDQ